MGIERARVLEVQAPGAVHAGYLLDDRLLLTAGAGGTPAKVRPAGTATLTGWRSVPATMAWGPRPTNTPGSTTSSVAGRGR